MSPQTSVERQMGHDGSLVGDDNVSLSVNDTGRYDVIASFGCPRKYQSIRYVGRNHPTQFQPRGVETFTGDGAQTDFQLAADLVPVTGEEELSDQPYPVVVAAEVGGGELEVASVDYATNTVSLSAAPASGTDVKFYPVLSEGQLKWQGLDVFDNPRGSIQTFGEPIHVFADLDQNNRNNRPHLSGGAEWSEGEELQLMFKSEHEICWEDADYPRGAYVSTFNQTVEVR